MANNFTNVHVRQEKLTDEQWRLVEPLISEPHRRTKARGRPSRDRREVLDGILWVLRHNAPWHELPDQFPSYQTCHRRFQQWVRDSTLRVVLEALEEDLRERGGLEVTEWLTRYQGAEGGLAPLENGSEDQQTRSWQQQTAMLFLSPATLRLLHRVRSRLARRLSLRYLPQAKYLAGACSVWAVLSAAESLRLQTLY
jgi:transposase